MAIRPRHGRSVETAGRAFIKLVKMVIAPVIFPTIVTADVMRDQASVGRDRGQGLCLLPLFFSTLALVAGLVVANTVRPGAGWNIDPASLDPGKVADYAEKAHETTITGFLTGIIPDTLPSSR